MSYSPVPNLPPDTKTSVEDPSSIGGEHLPYSVPPGYPSVPHYPQAYNPVLEAGPARREKKRKIGHRIVRFLLSVGFVWFLVSHFAKGRFRARHWRPHRHYEAWVRLLKICLSHKPN